MTKILRPLRAATSFLSCPSMPSLFPYPSIKTPISPAKSTCRQHHPIRLCSSTIENQAVSTALFHVQDKRVLLVCRGKAPNFGLWAFPGGSVEDGESLLEAAQRELTEETSVAWSTVSFMKDPVAIRRVSLPNDVVYVIHVFAAKVVESCDPVAACDAMDAKFLTFEQVSQLKCVDGLMQNIETAYDRIVKKNKSF